jgi:hypothetical protein
MSVVIPGSIGKNRRIQQFSAAGTLPGVERTDKIIELLGKHAAFTTWTMHITLPGYRNELRQVVIFIMCAKNTD